MSSPLPPSSGYDANTERLRNIADFFQSKYNFRSGARESIKNLSTWVDQDKSGDYDPDSKKNQPVFTPKRKREPPVKHGEQCERTKPKKPKTNTWQFGRRNGQSFPFTFKFNSDAGQALLKELSVAPDNWLSQPSYNEDSDPSTSWWSASGESFQTDNTSCLSQPYSLRKQPRSHLGGPSHWFDDRASHNIPGLDEITLGHPAARGCKGCLELRIPCTLLKEGYTYPCEDCVEDGMECELILPPLKKRPCESCRRRKIVCSYREGGDHSIPCQQCIYSNLKCIAGPLSGRTRTGPSLDQDFSAKSRFIPTPQRPFVTCTKCRQAKRWCSLKIKDQEAPCKHCKSAGIDCTFERLPEKSKKTGKVSKRRAEPLQQRQGLVASTETSATKTIKTRYAHPITFNFLPPEDNEDESEPCDWCESVAFGLLGLDEVEVEVIDRGAGQGYVEVRGGHTGKGKRPSRMCPECTLERLRISGCKMHDIQPIEDLDPDHFDFDAPFECLLPGTLPEAGAPQYRYCSVCPSPAFLECCKPSRSGWDGGEEDLGLSGRAGCGLLLCETCAVLLVEEHDGSLEGLVAALESDGDSFGLRADVEFLLESGELLQRITAGG